MLRLGDGFAIDISKALAEGDGLRFSLLGKSGSGKTNALFVLAEEVLNMGIPLLVIDPMNSFKNLRSLQHPVIVAGPRQSADVRLTLENAPLLAEWFFKMRVNLVIDMGMYEEIEGKEIVTAFLERFWRLVFVQDEDAAVQPYAIIVDEAHEFVPQGARTPTAKLLKDIAKRGRQLNISVFTATQRAASVDKDFLTQVNLMICLKVAMGLDAAVVAEGMSGTQRDVLKIMRKLHKGQALVIGDADLVDFGEEDHLIAQIRQTVVQYRRKTQIVDNDENAVQPVRMIDDQMLEALRAAMTGSDIYLDPAEEIIRLKRRVEELEAELGQARVHPQLKALPAGQPIITLPDLRVVETNHNPHVERRNVLVLPSEPRQLAMPLDSVNLNEGAERILNKLADLYPLKVSKFQIATLVGYTASGGTFQANWGSLKRARFVAEERNDVRITPDGFAYLGRELPKMPQTHEGIMAMWKPVVSLREWEILCILVSAFPKWVYKARLAELIGMAFAGGTFNGYLGNLHRNGLIEKYGQDVRANAASLLLGGNHAS